MKGTVNLMEKEVEYISDGNHNYLRINCGDERKNSYSFKMVTENTIKGLLPSRTRFVNGNTYLYYEIQSKQALYYRYETKEMDYEALKNIFYQLCFLGEELEKYLLDFKDIVFDEKYIYQNIETGETYFLFYPDKDEKQSFAVFMEYIVKKIDHKDAKAVQISYQLYDLSRQEHILIKEIKRLFEEEIVEVKTENKETNIKESNINIWKQEEKREWVTDEKDVRESVEWKYKDFGEEIIKEKEEKSKLRDIFIPSILCIVLTILICIKISFKLTYYEETLLIAGMVVDIGTFVVYLIHRLWKKNNKNKKESVQEINVFEKENLSLYGNSVEEKLKQNPDWNYFEQEKEEEYGKTVFMEPEAENILCGLGKHEKIIIKLEKFPFSIGKLKEEADYVLKDNSISRLHARFYQEGKNVYLVDLNSTNGTYKNGFKIPPNEKLLLEEGDEITFGKIRFCYR